MISTVWSRVSFPHYEQGKPRGVVKDWELFDSIELLERLLPKPSCGIVDSTIDSSLSLNIITSEMSLRDEFISFTHGFLKHETLCLLQAVIEGSKVLPEFLDCRNASCNTKGCFRKVPVFLHDKLDHRRGGGLSDLGSHDNTEWCLDFFAG